MPKRYLSGTLPPAKRRPGSRTRTAAQRMYMRRPRQPRYAAGGTLSIPRYLNNWQRTRDAPFPDRMSCKLLYSDQITYTIAASSSTNQVFRLNSIYDPDYTNVGHQPRGHDELALLYKRYCVTGCKYEIVGYSAATSATPGLRWAAFVTQDPTTTLISSVAYDMEESPLRVSPVIYEGNTAGHNAPNLIAQKAVGYIDLKSLYGVKDIFDDSDAEAGMGANPNRGAYLHVVGINNSAGGSTTFAWQVTLTYYVTLMRPVNMAAS